MVASLLENSGVPNATTPKTQSTPKNQAESELAKLLFFNRPERFLGWVPIVFVPSADAAEEG